MPCPWVGERDARVRLEQLENGSWILTDDVAGAKPGFPPLANVRPDQVGRARDLLELYARYSLPLRLATRCTDLPGQLKVSLLACPGGGVADDEAQTVDLPELVRHQALTYTAEVGNGFCVHVRNASAFPLRVVVVNCAATGLVEFLGEQVIDTRSAYRFWALSTQGRPFAPQPGAGGPYIERIVAIGTTRLDRDLRYMESKTSFENILNPSRDLDRNVTLTSETAAPGEKWDATEVLLGVGIPDAF